MSIEKLTDQQEIDKALDWTANRKAWLDYEQEQVDKALFDDEDVPDEVAAGWSTTDGNWDQASQVRYSKLVDSYGAPTDEEWSEEIGAHEHDGVADFYAARELSAARLELAEFVINVLNWALFVLFIVLRIRESRKSA